MRTAKMPKLILDFAGRTGDFVGFVVLRLKWYAFNEVLAATFPLESKFSV